MSYTAITNHNNVPTTIHELVFNRVGFLAKIQSNADIISNYIVEVCNNLESCFQVSWYDNNHVRQTTQDITRIGNELNYTISQKSLIADFVAIYMLERNAVINMGGKSVDDVTGDLTTSDKTFLSKAGAGSVVVEYSQFDSNKSNLKTSIDYIVSRLKEDAFAKGKDMGCLLDICPKCLEKFLELQALYRDKAIPFINIQTKI
jgi:NAD-dependent DNA ligase